MPRLSITVTGAKKALWWWSSAVAIHQATAAAVAHCTMKNERFCSRENRRRSEAFERWAARGAREALVERQRSIDDIGSPILVAGRGPASSSLTAPSGGRPRGGREGTRTPDLSRVRRAL